MVVQRILDTRKISGGIDENLNFTMGPLTDVAGSCAAQLNDEMFVFGGITGNWQVKYRVN